MNNFKGLTWGHPRGYLPLQAWATEDKGVDVDWSIQKLEGFESHPIDELAREYDLLIVDNPGIGEAAEKQCLLPLEDFLNEEQMFFLKQTSMGASYESYRYEGKHWAIPVDAASQVCARATTGDVPQPESWNDVVKLSQEFSGKIAMSLGGPHALLTFYSISQSLDGRLFVGNDLVLDCKTAVSALEIMREIFTHQQHDLINLNPIGLLDAMQNGMFDLCPAIFGYINYATPQQGRAVTFSNIPHCGDSALRGSVLGGTGLAISARCNPTPELIEHLMRYASDGVQSSLVVNSGGQPSNITAWKSEQANLRTNNFFANTFETVSSAYVRPKYDGYIPFQDTSAAIIRAGLIGGDSAEHIFSSIKENHRNHLPG
ncbi:hypothetical protein HA51_04905 [Pantoea rwandensis]|uniref:ABC transporter substrate-binding protein n=2 Tax=Pantoea rwandensis TaxID=1076550 RepID=A0A1X1D431_9GAMM|nr:hypothetical protein HA51_04905 [Pantoea rwandensis]